MTLLHIHTQGMIPEVGIHFNLCQNLAENNDRAMLIQQLQVLHLLTESSILFAAIFIHFGRCSFLVRMTARQVVYCFRFWINAGWEEMPKSISSMAGQYKWKHIDSKDWRQRSGQTQVPSTSLEPPHSILWTPQDQVQGSLALGNGVRDGQVAWSCHSTLWSWQQVCEVAGSLSCESKLLVAHTIIQNYTSLEYQESAY